MNFFLPTVEQIVKMYEGYRLEEEPDSPGIPFADLSIEEQDKVCASFETFHRSILIDDELLGFVTVYPFRDRPEVNLGMYLFPEHRGKGLSVRVLRALIPLAMAEYPERAIVASTRIDNAPMISALLSAGFQKAEVEVRGSLGKWEQEISYQRFVFQF